MRSWQNLPWTMKSVLTVQLVWVFHLPDEILFDGCWYSHFFLPLSSWVFTRLSILLGSSPVWPSLCLTETFQSWSGREILSFLDLDLSEAGRKLERSSMHPNWSKRRCLFATRIFRQMIRPRLKKKGVFDNLLFKANCSCQSCLCWLIGHCLRYASFHLL